MASEYKQTPVFRLAFPTVFKPKESRSGKKQYSITMLFPKDQPELLMPIRKMLVKTIKDKWGDDKKKWPGILGKVDLKEYLSPTGQDGWPVRDGDMVSWDGFAGHFFVRAAANEDYKPGVIDRNKQEVLDPSDVFGGLLARAIINTFAYSNESKGVSVGLAHLQILKDDGTRFSGVGKAKDLFDDDYNDGSEDESSYGDEDDF